jgi:uncharacterized protein YlzI (FlbEa/FlbD family)
MILLHYYSGVPYWLDENKIECLDEHEAGTAIFTVSNNKYICREMPAKVVALIDAQFAGTRPVLKQAVEAADPG